MSTNIEDIFNFKETKEDDLKFDFDIQNLSDEEQLTYLREVVFNYEQNINKRVTAFIQIYEKNKLEAQEITTDLSTIYYFTPTSFIKEIIIELCNISSVDLTIRYPLCCCIFNNEESKDESYKLFSRLLEDSIDNEYFNFTFCIDILKILLLKSNGFYSDLYKDKSLIKVLDYITRNKEHQTVFYKTLMTLYNTNEYYYNFIFYINYLILSKTDNMNLKILICSFFIYNIEEEYYEIILKEINIDKKEFNRSIKDILKEISENPYYEYNNRANSADILLSLNKEEDKEYNEIGKRVINELSSSVTKGDKNNNSLYEDKQNVHRIEVDDSIKNFIKTLSLYRDMCCKQVTDEDENIFNSIENILINMLIEEEKKLFIKQTLTRIYLDTKLYEGYRLVTIFVKSWEYINNHPNKEELIKRLIEEIIEMKDTCSTGHIARLINVFSGLDDNIEIKFNLKSIIQTKINFLLENKIRKENENKQDELINEMISDEEFNEYNKYIMKNLSEFKAEIYNECKDLVRNEIEFEEIFRETTLLFIKEV